MYTILTPRYIGFLLVLVLVIAPFTGYGLAYVNYTLKDDTVATLAPPDRTKDDLQKAIDNHRSMLNPDSAYPESRIVSFEKKYDSWYIVVVKQTISDEYHSSEPTIHYTKMLIGDFYESPDNLVVVIEPDRQLFRKNISYNTGVPYDVIDEVYKPIGSEVDTDGQ